MASGNNRGFWQRAALFYNRAVKGDSAVYDSICEKMQPYLNKEQDVLELACGTGLITHRLGANVRFWEATDYSEAMIRQAKKEHYPETVHFSLQDATALPYAAETFDVIVIANALHIVPDPVKILNDVKRVIKRNGILLAPCFIREDGITRKMLLANLLGFRTYSKWNTNEYISFLETNGFEVIERERLENGTRFPVCFAAAKLKQ